MGCASLPGVSPNMKPMERLLLAEKREVALLKKDFTSLWQERKMGMKVIRDCVQHEFEEFMCTDWVHRINAHLKEVFLQLSDKNANLGMPMAPLQSYVPHLQNILSVVPVVFPDFKESMLQVTSTHAFKGILADRVKIVCANSQWIQFGSSKIWATIAAAREQMNARTPQWNAGPVAFDKCLAEAATAKQLLISALCKQADELKAETFALSVKFMAALLEIQKRPNSNVFRTAYNFLLSAFTDEDKPEVHKMERFPRLVEAFRVYIDKAIQESAMKFEAAAKVYIDNVQDVVRIKYRSEGGNVVANLQWREDADAHFDNLINIHLKETLTSLPALTHAFVIPDPLLQEEACAPARAKLLTEMSDIATALIALKRLIDRVEAAKQAANDPCSVNNP